MPSEYIEAGSDVLVGFFLGGNDGLLVAAECYTETFNRGDGELIYMITHYTE